MASTSPSVRSIAAGCTWPKAAKTSAARMPIEAPTRSPYPALSPAPGRHGQPAAGWRGGAAALASGPGWRLRAEGARMTLEESVYLGGRNRRRGEQIVLTGYATGRSK